MQAQWLSYIKLRWFFSKAVSKVIKNKKNKLFNSQETFQYERRKRKSGCLIKQMYMWTNLDKIRLYEKCANKRTKIEKYLYSCLRENTIYCQ